MQKSYLEVVMEHLLAVEQVCTGLAQITQIYLHREGNKNIEYQNKNGAVLFVFVVILVNLPEHLSAVWADETATLYRSWRAAAGTQLCDRPHPDRPDSAQFALHSGTEAGESVDISHKRDTSHITVKRLLTVKLQVIIVLPAECVLDALQQSPGLH